MNIILTGSLAFDRIMDFPGLFGEHILPDKIHSLNVSFNIETLTEKHGGTAGNIAYSLCLLGEMPRIVAAVGSDAEVYIAALQARGLATDDIEMHSDVLTAVANIMTDRADNQITAFYMGAMARETTFQLSSMQQSDKTIVVLSAGNKADMLRYREGCKQMGIPYVFDPGQTIPFLTPDELRTLISGADVFITNDYELQMIMNRTGLAEKEIQSQVGMLITTLGSKGSTICTQQDRVSVAACRVNDVVDPTGAGDAFRAGVLTGMSRNCSVEQLGRLGAVAAAYAVEVYGTQEHHYTHDQFAKRYQENFNENCPI